MRSIVLIVLVLTCPNSFGQIDSNSPSVPSSALSAQAFVPTGWRLYAQVHGDLNQDGLEDLALVIQSTNPDLIIKNDGLGVSEFDTNPRTLIIAFAATKEFRRVLQNDDFIAIADDPTMDDPFEPDALTIAHGVLRMHFHVWFSAGSWGTSEQVYSFRYQHESFELIGYDGSNLMRNSGGTSKISVNFSTQKMEECIGSIEREDCDKRKLIQLKNRPLLKLSDLGNALNVDSLALPPD